METSQEVVLHIGAGKTGTSFLQSCFSVNRDVLFQAGYYYPPAPEEDQARRGEVTSGNAIRLARFLNPSLLPHLDTPSDDSRIDQDTAIANGKNILYSSEFLMYFKPARMQSFRDRLAEEGRRLRVVMYVRPPSDYVRAAYDQRLKRHRYKENFVTFFRGFELDIVDTLTNLASVLPHDDISVRNYETAKSDLLGDFLRHVLNLGDLSKFNNLANRAINRRLTSDEMAFMLALNKYLTADAEGTFVSDALIQEPAGNPLPLAENPVLTIEDFEHKFAESVDFINKFLTDDQKLDLATDRDLQWISDIARSARYSPALLKLIARLASSAVKAGRS